MGTGTVFFKFHEACSCSYGHTWVGNESCPELPALVPFDVCVNSGGKVKSWVGAFYMSVVTVTTVGFGDFTPVTRGGRIFAIVWMFVGVAATAFFITTLASFLFDDDTDDDLHPEDALSIDRDLFDKIDIAGTGELTRAEYYEFVLVKHGLVDLEVMNSMRAAFDSFEGGESVTWEQMRRVRNKLRSQRTIEMMKEQEDA